MDATVPSDRSKAIRAAYSRIWPFVHGKQDDGDAL